MNHKTIFTFAFVLVAALGIGVLRATSQTEGFPPERAPQAAVGTAFTYQGHLNDGGSPANGSYDFQFSLYDAASGGAQIGGMVTISALAVSNGLFTASLDFGAGAFNGETRYLAISVAPANTGSYAALAPRQEITASPYALGLPGVVTDGSGDVAIGTDSPNHRFDVQIPNDSARSVEAHFGNGTHGVSIYNSTGAGYVPVIRGEASDNRESLYLIGDAEEDNDTGTRSIVGISGRVENGAVTNRPILSVLNFRTPYLTVTADGLTILDGLQVNTTATSNVFTFPNDDGFIRSKTSDSDSDIFLQSNDAVEINLNVDGTSGEDSDFLVKHGSNVIFNVDESGTTTVEVLEIDGGMDIAEPFVINDDNAIEAGTVVVLDPANPGQLRVSDGAYDPLVAGIVSGAGGINPGLVMQQSDLQVDGETHPVALTGQVYVKAVGNVQIGDLLTTSHLPGHAMTASDRDRAFGAVIGKAMSAQDGGTGLILVLVALQ